MKTKKEMDRLSRNALMATRLHMTYGKYMAMKYERERKTREEQERLVREAKEKREDETLWIMMGSYIAKSRWPR